VETQPNKVLEQPQRGNPKTYLLRLRPRWKCLGRRIRNQPCADFALPFFLMETTTMENDQNKTSFYQKPRKIIESTEGALAVVIASGLSYIIAMAITGIIFKLLFH